ncbi:MAG: acyltransferase family protein [Reyranellaceae bacterium]
MTGGRRIEALTGLRGVAALVVLAFHLRAIGGPADDLAGERGYLAVHLFFVLSGYVMCHAHFAEYAQGAFSYARFIGLRLGRIWPAHLAVLGLWLLAIAAASLAGIPFNADSEHGLGAYVLAYATMVHAWGMYAVHDFNPPSWSVSAEWFAYLLFPLFATAVRPLRGPAAIAVAAGALLAASFAVLLSLDAPAMAYDRLVLARTALGFALGCLMWRLAQARPPARLSAWAGDAAALGIVLLAFIAPPADAIDFLYLALFALLVFGLGEERGLVARALASPPMRFLGEISYSLYLIHWLAMGASVKLWTLAFGPPQGGWTLVVAAIATIVSLVAATGLYRLVEAPARQAVRRFLARQKAPA